MRKTMNIANSRIYFLVTVLLLGGCASPGVYQVNLIPAPDVFAEGMVNPFPDQHPLQDAPYKGILYATDRLPVITQAAKTESEEDEVYYKNKRGVLLRLGLGRIEIDRRALTGGKKAADWDEIRRISLEKHRTYNYPLQIKQIHEIGILDRSFNSLMSEEDLAKKSAQPAKQYAELINKKLAQSKRKDIYIYVHGYNTNFEDPLLVASELWHYMGYDGVFIAYAWPATPRGLAYLADLDTARLASRNLRIFLEYLSEQTDAENIHIIGYSMGTRVTTYAIQDAALINYGQTHQQIHKKLHIGNIILIGSDLDRGVFLGFMLDGFMNVPNTFTVYMSDTDSALSASRWLFERYRLGEAWVNNKPPEFFVEYLKEHSNLRFIDVTHARDADTGNGHHYFTASPWVSSDLLLTLMFDLKPEQRGLVRDQYGMWKFSDDHLAALKRELSKLAKSQRDVNKK